MLKCFWFFCRARRIGPVVVWTSTAFHSSRIVFLRHLPRFCLSEVLALSGSSGCGTITADDELQLLPPIESSCGWAPAVFLCERRSDPLDCY